MQTEPHRDHPRGCGAHAHLGEIQETLGGSSPRVRGSLDCFVDCTLELGIIPAGAGLTHVSRAGHVSGRDHPRGCGAHNAKWFLTEKGKGSSPRVRGSQDDAGLAAQHRGIIPAGAGLTLHHCSSHCRYRDHPRGCGAHNFVSQYIFDNQGSSPRVRGSPCDDTDDAGAVGIIPAGAGLTRASCDSRWHGWDHPRGCGAHR